MSELRSCQEPESLGYTRGGKDHALPASVSPAVNEFLQELQTELSKPAKQRQETKVPSGRLRTFATIMALSLLIIAGPPAGPR